PPTTAPPTTAPPTTAPPTTTPPAPPTTLTAQHTARRLTNGSTPAVISAITAAGGPLAWIDAQLNMAASADAALDSQIATSFPRTVNNAIGNFALGEAWEIRVELPAATTMRSIFAQRQLFEQTVAFLWDHFSVDLNNDRAQASCGEYDQLLRAGAFGRFSDLLLAVARSAAMMNYLNQATSRADGSNVPIENFAREIMELHTVGVDGGYNEDDVKAVSYLLSGWTRQLIDWMPIGPFQFNSTFHRLGPFQDPNRTVLGWSRGSLTGEAAGLSFINHIARHPTTAQRLAHKLAIRFIGDHVQRTDAVVTAAAQAYLANDTSIRATLRSLLTSNEFAASANRRIKRPTELYASMVRAVANTSWNGASVRDARWSLVGATDGLNQVPHWWPDPDGYPDRDTNWVGVGAMIGRWNMSTWVVLNLPNMFTVNWTTIRNWTTGTTIGEWFTAACSRLGVSVPTATRDRMLTELYRDVNSPLTQNGNTWAMQRLLIQLLQSPDFQVR
ncbi:MAG: DUF1800 domain-containing protein, partial [Actinobacteria bacterium]|nr:DUF1800 domain-containing protein [Actinomycetota bacterium]